MAEVKFARGAKAKYDAAAYRDNIYFVTDTKEILVNGIAYGISDTLTNLINNGAITEAHFIPSVADDSGIIALKTTNGNFTINIAVASSGNPGLMSGADKLKLNGLSKYTLPIATASALGGVKAATASGDGNGIMVGADGTLKLDWSTVLPPDMTVDAVLDTMYLRKDKSDTSTGSITAVAFIQSSDERLKNFISDAKFDIDDILEIPIKFFEYKDKPGETQLGTSAQEIQKICPEIVKEDKNGYLAVDYGKLSMIALSAVHSLNDRLKIIENKLGL